jgi:hypothetical protein
MSARLDESTSEVVRLLQKWLVLTQPRVQQLDAILRQYYAYTWTMSYLPFAGGIYELPGRSAENEVSRCEHRLWLPILTDVWPQKGRARVVEAPKVSTETREIFMMG